MAIQLRNIERQRNTFTDQRVVIRQQDTAHDTRFVAVILDDSHRSLANSISQLITAALNCRNRLTRCQAYKAPNRGSNGQSSTSFGEIDRHVPTPSFG